MLSDLSVSHAHLIYEAFYYALGNNSGIGIPHQDQGDVGYVEGAETGETNEVTGSDNPRQSDLFKLMTKLSAILDQDGQFEAKTGMKPVHTWQDFCRIVLAGYRK